MAFRGQIAEIPVGLRGLTGTKHLASIQPDHLIRAEGVIYEGSSIQKEGGAAKYNGTAISGTPKIMGGWDWDHDGSTQRSIVYTNAGTLLKDDGAGDYTAATLKSGLNTDDRVGMFVEGGKEAAANNRKLFFLNGVDIVQVLSANGATTGNLATPPADWSGTNQPNFGLIHEDRLMAGGNVNDPHRLYYSTITNHEDFTGSNSGTLAIYPGEGEGLVAGVSFRNAVILFKRPRGIYAVDTSDPTVANWKVIKITGEWGAANPRCVQVIDDDVVFLDNTGAINVVSATPAFGNFRTRSLTDVEEMDTWIRDNVNFGPSDEWVAQFYPEKREVHFGMTGTGAVDNNLRIVLDMNIADKLRWRVSFRDTPTALWLKKDGDGINRLTHGDDGGFVWNMDQATKSKDGVGYEALFQTRHEDFAWLDPMLSTIQKNFKFLELVVEPKGDHNLTVTTFLDGAEQDTLQFPMGTSGTALGAFILGTSILGGGDILNKKLRMTGRGRRISLVGSNSGADEDFAVSKFLVHFTPGNEAL
jgi:hypothetical protein